jgi:triosephosphate isomerase
MTATPRPLVAGNWKMNGLRAQRAEFEVMVKDAPGLSGVLDLLVCPPATLLADFAVAARGSRIAIGAQDCHAKASGAYTGDISAEMIADCGATFVIVGHSERRTLHQENDATVNAKTRAAWRAGLTAVVCIGETQQQREAGPTLEVVGAQLNGSIPTGATAERLVVAYEPVWAIGTGLTPTTEDVEEVHASIRLFLRETLTEEGEAIRILYGGSVKPANAGELLGVANVNGALVGGASLKADDFFAIARAYS